MAQLLSVYLKRSFLQVVLLPDIVVTVTSTFPRGSAGATAVIELGELTVKELAAFDPKSIALTDTKLVPVIVTAVPPVDGPLFGDNPVTVGAGATNTHAAPGMPSKGPPSSAVLPSLERATL
jgi:hypothetical protein